MNVLVDMTETIQLAKQATELETDTLFKFKELTKFKQEQLQKWHETAQPFENKIKRKKKEENKQLEECKQQNLTAKRE